MSARDELAALLGRHQFVGETWAEALAMRREWLMKHGNDVLALIDAARRFDDPFPDDAAREELQLAVARLTGDDA